MSLISNHSACPVCTRPIDVWAVRTIFTCHHCKWALKSNFGAANAGAALLSLLAAACAFLVMPSWVHKWYETLAWICVALAACAVANRRLYRWLLVLRPLRAQPKLRD